MDHRAFKTEINEQFTRIAKAIANPHRLELVDLLAQGERSVEELAKEAALSVARLNAIFGSKPCSAKISLTLVAALTIVLPTRGETKPIHMIPH